MSDDNIDWHLMFGRAAAYDNTHKHRHRPRRKFRRHDDDNDDLLSFFEVKKYLGLSSYQLLQVIRHQDFPKRDDEFGWLKRDIKMFKAKMKRARRDGLKVPDIFFGPRQPELEPV